MWYLRNDLFFDLHADTRPDVLLVLYEDLVANPQQHVPRVFNFIGMPLPPGVVAVIEVALTTVTAVAALPPNVTTASC